MLLTHHRNSIRSSIEFSVSHMPKLSNLTMRFEWLECRDKENSTWLGGFNCEC